MVTDRLEKAASELLNNDEVLLLKYLNNRLQDIEKKAGEMVLLLYSQALTLVQDNSNPIQYYELTTKVPCFISEDSPYFEMLCADDNAQQELIILESFPQSKPAPCPFYFGHNQREHNYNQWVDIKGHPFEGDKHCWCFNQLYSRFLDYQHYGELQQKSVPNNMAPFIDTIMQNETPWSVLLNIGRLWLDVDVEYQYFNAA